MNEIKERVIFSKTARTVALFSLLAALPYTMPALSRYRIVNLRTGEASVSDSSAPQAIDLTVEAETKSRMIPGEIEDPTGHALDNFFAALLKTEAEAGQTRISHYGDSPITNDGITSTVRRKLQLKFGDGGHGFILATKPWAWYGHAGVAHEASGGWSTDPIFISRGDHLYGLGGATAKADAAGATASFSTASEGEVGRAVSSFDIYFLAQPSGGDFDIEVDDKHYSRVSTAGDQTGSAFHRVELDKGAHRLTIKTAGDGEVRLFGVAMETAGAGVQYDSLGVNGAFIGLLAHYLDEQHWAEQLRRRRPDLVIIGYGANESQFERLPMDQYERDTKEVTRRIRAALPGASIMFIGPMDRGMRGPGGGIITRPMIPKLIAYQRRVAAQTGCAFFDTYSAMGGEGTVARWREAKPKLMGGDLTHPTAQGSERVGTLIFDAIIRAYEEYKVKRSL
ncbi:MAG TPA: GDSL-type esterase/lipase family protein [Blastocatellia bacterium]|nr:GDSL-type esterase/lipase family protein [Blastocatellia bacterium]